VNQPPNDQEETERLDLLQGTLDMMVLRRLSAGPANGYEIGKAIERLSDEVLAVDHGSLYPAAPAGEGGTDRRQVGNIVHESPCAVLSFDCSGEKQLVVERSKWKQLAAAVTRVMRPAT
jgi:PadR family transcriptional regulator PadR